MTGRGRAIIRLVAGLLLVLSCASCGFGRDDNECESFEEYQKAATAPEITVPAGLDKPDPSSRLNVPPSQVPGEALSKEAECLQRPPTYFDRPILPANN
jgi:uncharacterized lipoprotein